MTIKKNKDKGHGREKSGTTCYQVKLFHSHVGGIPERSS